MSLPQTVGPFKYKQPTEEQTKNIIYFREACDELYDKLRRYIPQCAEQTLAIRKLEECSMWANKAIVFDGERYL